jgi:hypothetical protein
MEARQKEYQGEDPLRDRIEDYLAIHNPKQVSLRELAFHCMDISEENKFDQREAKRISRALEDLGCWAPSRTRPKVMNPWKPSSKAIKSTVYVRV